LPSDFAARSVPESVLDSLYTAVGHLVISWAFVDRALDFWIAIIFHDAGGKEIELQIPSAFDRKTKFLRRCFRRIEALSPFSEEALPYIEAACGFSNTRHFVVHGTMSDYRPEGHIFTFVNLRPDKPKTMHQLSQLHISAVQLLEDGVQCSELGGQMLDLGQRLLETLVPEGQRGKIMSSF
jgi:hypothetical protein